MEHIPITIKCKVDENKDLQPYTVADQVRKDIFKTTLEPGNIVEITYQVYNPDYSTAQLDKVHKCIRQLALDLGYTFQEMKDLVKEKAGFPYNDQEKKYKSFSDCSKEEISMAIQAGIAIGDDVGSNLHAY